MPRGRREHFVTAAAMDIAVDELVLTMVSCGHPPPLLVHAGRVTPLQCEHPPPPLGGGGLCEHQGHTGCSFRFEEGDLLLLYTDGVTEALLSDGRSDRLLNAGGPTRAAGAGMRRSPRLHWWASR
ncbi:SpoIIE family protein phosphatase [Streptosporangium amethystogenes]|uniref:SpoIIE family protein phosphatase n=1 Tax=Streptosporangium amethystogenes TaxID=2002 RepID=UPI0009FE637F